jgi:hypothetical protein
MQTLRPLHRQRRRRVDGQLVSAERLSVLRDPATLGMGGQLTPAAAERAGGRCERRSGWPVRTGHRPRHECLAGRLFGGCYGRGSCSGGRPAGSEVRGLRRGGADDDVPDALRNSNVPGSKRRLHLWASRRACRRRPSKCATLRNTSSHKAVRRRPRAPGRHIGRRRPGSVGRKVRQERGGCLGFPGGSGARGNYHSGERGGSRISFIGRSGHYV